jgi:hypothetical protein
MRYMILIYNDPSVLDGMSEAEEQADYQGIYDIQRNRD